MSATLSYNPEWGAHPILLVWTPAGSGRPNFDTIRITFIGAPMGCNVSYQGDLVSSVVYTDHADGKNKTMTCVTSVSMDDSDAKNRINLNLIVRLDKAINIATSQPLRVWLPTPPPSDVLVKTNIPSQQFLAYFGLGGNYR